MWLPFWLRRYSSLHQEIAHRALIWCANIFATFVMLGAVLYATMTDENLPGAHGAPQTLSFGYFAFVTSGIIGYFAAGTFFCW
jgi:hypothetical protein